MSESWEAMYQFVCARAPSPWWYYLCISDVAIYITCGLETIWVLLGRILLLSGRKIRNFASSAEVNQCAVRQWCTYVYCAYWGKRKVPGKEYKSAFTTSLTWYSTIFCWHFHALCPPSLISPLPCITSVKCYGALQKTSHQELPWTCSLVRYPATGVHNHIALAYR